MNQRAVNSRPSLYTLHYKRTTLFSFHLATFGMCGYNPKLVSLRGSLHGVRLNPRSCSEKRMVLGK